jgi:hypothetical protein
MPVGQATDEEGPSVFTIVRLKREDDRPKEKDLLRRTHTDRPSNAGVGEGVLTLLPATRESQLESLGEDSSARNDVPPNRLSGSPAGEELDVDGESKKPSFVLESTLIDCLASLR